MKLEKLPLKDMFLVHREVFEDERGRFSRLFASDELSKAGLPIKAIHINSSTSTKTGTLRGIHFQFPPYAEAKIVSCTAGSIWDLGVDLRPGSKTRFQWFACRSFTYYRKSSIISFKHVGKLSKTN